SQKNSVTKIETKKQIIFDKEVRLKITKVKNCRRSSSCRFQSKRQLLGFYPPHATALGLQLPMHW
ncbi:hypothetical protein, partial [Yersinia pestis]